MAGQDHGKTFTEQHPPRPPIQTHHSSSVPSTPYQQPRDLHFGSRSPSPGRGLRDNSPRSVVSEAVGHGAAAQRSQPVVCKFETGAEIRKRRIPYVDGGNEELGPPKKGIKKSLDAEEQQKLKGQMDELYQRLLPSDESEDRRARLVKKLDRILNEEWPGNNIRVNVFGSSGNLLSSSDSDVDICITTTLKRLESMHSIATLLHKNGMEKVVCRASAKVPIVKCWDPELELAADLNVNNPLALENTRMIKTYVQLDPRVRPLAKIIKYWTKRRILNDAAFGGTISSYTWICMIINFLQRRHPPILPSLQKRAGERDPCDKDETPRFADDLEAMRDFGNGNKETLPELLFYFFRHYGYEFEYSKHVVSVREGRLISRKEKGWDPSNYANKEAQNRLCVEEPFTMIRNLGNSADDYAWSGIHGEIRRAFDLLADGGQLEKCCEEYEFPPEEKPIFQRPAPKPKPTLTRSASQSGRSTHEQGSGRSRKGGNRNQSAQRAGNRRASSGASFSNQRGPVPPFQSPPLSGGVMDYFGLKTDLHNHLFQQWQYLQAQTEALKSQLAAQQQQQQQTQLTSSQGGQGRANELSGSPHHRVLANGLPSPRYLDHPPATAPLPPGSLYHYPSRYPPPSPMSQVRTREGGTSTNPSSPSLVAAVPALRRQVHRGSIPEGSSSSIRSQSQPGRSLPHPLLSLNMQQHVHPGYDVSGAMPMPYQSVRSSSGAYTAVPTGMPMPVHPSAMGPFASNNGGADNAIPKEYVGYYVGQSPGLAPQFATHAPMVSMPPMTLRDPPAQRQRRVTPELLPPTQNGRHSSRSPSPLGHLRSYTTPSELPTMATQGLKSPPLAFEMPTEMPAAKAQEPTQSGPLIVNGSGTSALASTKNVAAPVGTIPAEQPNGVVVPAASTVSTPNKRGDFSSAVNGIPLSRVQTLPLRTNLDSITGPENSEVNIRSPLSPSPRIKSGPNKLNLSQTTTPTNGTTSDHHFHEPASVPAPLLSPVAELRTPSPTRPTAYAERDSPTAIANGVAKAARAANATANLKFKENVPPGNSPAVPGVKHERKGSAPNPSSTTSMSAATPNATSPSVWSAKNTLKSPTSPTAPAPKTAPWSAFESAGGPNGTVAGKAQVLPLSSHSTNSMGPPVGVSSNASSTAGGVWQTATRKGHKKSKSASNPMPVNEADRKGG